MPSSKFNNLLVLSFLTYFLAKIPIFQCQSTQNPCLNGGVSVVGPASGLGQVCICNKNYIGAQCETRLDTLTSDQKKKYGCELRPCWLGSTCEDRDGSFVCHCSANTFGEFCEKSSLSNNDPCASRPCYNYGTCVQQDQNSYTCQCNGSYGGLSCKQNVVGACASNPCLRDGICVPIGQTDYKCQCPDWTLGKNCEVVFNPCNRVTCMNNGICLKKRTLAYECNCTSGYTGLLCDQPLQQSCKSTPCVYGTCQLNTSGQFSCFCASPGYEGTYCEVERCNPKCKNGYCVADSNGNPYCQCASNFRGSSCSDLVCFSGSTQVETLNGGHKKISDLVKGDYIKSYDLNKNEWIYSRFVTFMHKDEDIIGRYIHIETSLNRTLSISPLHLIARSLSIGNIEFVFAKELRLNDILITESKTTEKVTYIEEIYEKGAFAPLTESGTIVVNSILASCYANTHLHGLVHALFKPILKISNYFNIDRIFEKYFTTPTPLTTTTTTATTTSVYNPHLKLNLSNNVYWYAKFLFSLLPYVPFSSSFVIF